MPTLARPRATRIPAVLALAAAVLVSAAGGAAAQQPFPEAEYAFGYPLPPVGTFVQYTDNMSLEVVAVDPATGIVRVISQSTLYGEEVLDLVFGLDWAAWSIIEDGQVDFAVEYQFDRTVLADLWPLSLGFEVRYSTTEVPQKGGDPILTTENHAEVLAAERLDTPLGRLPVMRTRLTVDLGEDDQGVASSNILVRWFHPAFGLPVRMEDSYLYGDEPGDAQRFDLISVTFPQDEPPAPQPQ